MVALTLLVPARSKSTCALPGAAFAGTRIRSPNEPFVTCPPVAATTFDPRVRTTVP